MWHIWQRSIFRSLVCCLLLVCQGANGDVSKVYAQGFDLHIEIEVKSGTAWQKFLQVQNWWDLNHSWFGPDSIFNLDSIAGGCLCERKRKQSVQHMKVIYVDPGREMRLGGALGPLQTMALRGLLTMRFTPLENGKTRIEQIYKIRGVTEQGFDNLSKIVDKVQTDQMQRLENYINHGQP